MSRLFTPLTLREVTFGNRIWISPMCQYSSVDGRPNDWHLVHLSSLARGGAGLVFTEATAVTPVGRISPVDAGIWNDEQAQEYRPIVDFIHGQGAAAGIQLAHAGRKGSTAVPWQGRGYLEPDQGGWQTVGASPLGYATGRRRSSWISTASPSSSQPSPPPPGVPTRPDSMWSNCMPRTATFCTSSCRRCRICAATATEET